DHFSLPNSLPLLDFVKGRDLRFSRQSPAHHGGESWLFPRLPSTSLFAVSRTLALTAANATCSSTSSPWLSVPSSAGRTPGTTSPPLPVVAKIGSDASWNCPTASPRTTPSGGSSTASTPCPCSKLSSPGYTGPTR